MTERNSPKRELIDALTRMKAVLAADTSPVAIAQARGITDHALTLANQVGERQNIKKPKGVPA